MHARLSGVSQTQMMGRHKANHIQVAYGQDDAGARDAALTKAALARNLGVAVTLVRRSAGVGDNSGYGCFRA